MSQPHPKTKRLNPLGRVVTGIVFGVPAFALLLYICNAVAKGSYVLAWGSGKMSRNNNSIYLESPLAIVIWMLFHLSLVFLAGALAINPYWLAKKKILIPTVISLIALNIIVSIIIKNV